MAKKVTCITMDANAFAKKLEELLNESEEGYYNIIPVTSNTAGEFKAIIIVEDSEEINDLETEMKNEAEELLTASEETVELIIPKEDEDNKIDLKKVNTLIPSKEETE